MRAPVELPAGAAAKLAELQLQRDSSLDAAQALAGRLNRLPRDAPADQRDRLELEQNKHSARHAQLARVLSACNQWRMELRPGVTLEPACPVVFKPKDNETLPAAVERLRSQIASTRQSLQRVRSAPLPLADQKQLCADYVQRLARTGRPRVAVQRDQINLTPSDFGGVLGLLCWIDPQALTAALARELVEVPGAMSAPERTSAVSRLQDQLDQLERSEQALIEHAHANGTEILPRVDTDPAAYLGVVVVTSQAKTEAAA